MAFGLSLGGSNGSASAVIDKNDHVTDGAASNVANLSTARSLHACVSSSSHCFSLGGYTTTPIQSIEKIDFSTLGVTSGIGNLSANKYMLAGLQSSDNGFIAGGYTPNLNAIEKLSFATEGSTTAHCNLSSARRLATGLNDVSNGYGFVAAGYESSIIKKIDKFSFSSTSNATLVANLGSSRSGSAGASSSSDGFVSSGMSLISIESITFSTNIINSSVGNLSIVHNRSGGQSGITHAYVMGGDNGSGTETNVFEKYLYAASSSGSSVGTLTVARDELACGQYLGLISFSLSTGLFDINETSCSFNLTQLQESGSFDLTGMDIEIFEGIDLDIHAETGLFDISSSVLNVTYTLTCDASLFNLISGNLINPYESTYFEFPGSGEFEIQGGNLCINKVRPPLYSWIL